MRPGSPHQGQSPNQERGNNMPKYTITIADIRDYLSTVPEGEPVGIPQHNYNCLIGKTLQWKYPGKLSFVDFHNQWVHIAEQSIEPPEAVQEVAETFDDPREH